MSQTVRIATRGSELARWQADHVANALIGTHSDLTVELVEVQTTGDVLRDVPLSTVASSAFFTREIEEALLDGRADLAVHSLKDLASEDVPGLRLGAVLEREDPRDALLSTSAATLAALPAGARVGTSSVRRRALVASLRPDLELVHLRGNVPTRIAKLDGDAYDAIVLATAGLERLGLGHRITELLEPGRFVPAAGQGAIAVQVRADDAVATALVAPLEHAHTRVAVDAERTFLAELSVGCQAPVGVYASLEDDGDLSLRAVVLSTDGSERLELSDTGSPDLAADLGRRLAAEARSRGGAELIEAARTAEAAP